ncbi:hypothetical protein LCGC14_2862530, partial [marine sediment metagenome]
MLWKRRLLAREKGNFDMIRETITECVDNEKCPECG